MQNWVQATVISYQFKFVNNSHYRIEVLDGQMIMPHHYENRSAGSTLIFSNTCFFFFFPSMPSSFSAMLHVLIHF